MGAWGQQTPPSPFQPGGLRHGGGMKKNGGGVCKGDAVGGCSARDALQRCWGGWGGERMAAVRSWGSCARTRARCAGFVPPHASWGGGNTQDGARTRRDHRHPLSLAHVHRHPHAPHAHPLQQPQPPGKVPAPGFQPPPQALPTFLHPSLLPAQLLLQLPAPFHLPPAHAGRGAEAAASPGDPTVPGTGFGDLLSPQLQRVPRLWWLRSGERQRAAAAGCADGSRARSAWR